jgi:hypothetical protein
LHPDDGKELAVPINNCVEHLVRLQNGRRHITVEQLPCAHHRVAQLIGRLCPEQDVNRPVRAGSSLEKTTPLPSDNNPLPE